MIGRVGCEDTRKDLEERREEGGGRSSSGLHCSRRLTDVASDKVNASQAMARVG